MKKLFAQSIITLLFFTFLGCSSDSETPPVDNVTPKTLTADFEFSGTDDPAPAVINFTNKSANATDYYWEFGDNSSSTEINPSHTYESKGTYTVTLTAISLNSADAVSTSKIVVIVGSTSITSVTINKITITEMVFVDANGKDWDSSTDGPDVLFSIVESDNYTKYLNSTTYKNVEKSQLPLTWTLTTPKLITDLSKEYDFSLAEMDGDGGNNIADFNNIKMSDYTTGTNPYPKTITLKDVVYHGTNTIVLDVTWQ